METTIRTGKLTIGNDSWTVREVGGEISYYMPYVGWTVLYLPRHIAAIVWD